MTAGERASILAKNPMKGAYDTTIDNESAYELLAKRVEQAPEASGGILDTISSTVGGWLGEGERPKTGPGSRAARRRRR